MAPRQAAATCRDSSTGGGAARRGARPQAKLRILGDGPLRASLESTAKALEIGHAVQFAGAVPHAMVLDALSSSTVLCLPSVHARSGDEEGLGQVLLEAGAAERPVVATTNGGIVDAVQDGRTGFLVDERDPGALAERLLAVLVDEGLARRLGRAGREFVLAEFDVHRQARRLADEYERAISGD